MPKPISSYELTLGARPPRVSLTNWLYQELRQAILDSRLAPGTRLPASRDFATQHGLSRGTVVGVFERLQAEGYISSRVGSGTRVNSFPTLRASEPSNGTPPDYVRRAISGYVRPKPWTDIVVPNGVHPFAMGAPDVAGFPAKIWGSIARRRARSFASWLRTEEDARGYRPLREAIAHYLGASRGVRCGADQVIVVSGVQQALDLLARVLLKDGDPVWMEDPGYFGASIAFSTAGAKVIPVPVDQQGLDVAAGVRTCRHARGAYVTPAHQFPLGMAMSLERRMELLKWAARAGAFIIEDDYDSEFRFEGPPIPALQGLDESSNVILVGSFSKLLFPSVRIGYIVLPPALADYFLAFRYRTDFRNVNFDQAVLCDFITEGHLVRHLRRMRDLYAARFAALLEGGKRYLEGQLSLSECRAGLYTVGFLENGMTSWEAEKLATAGGIQVSALDRYTLKQPDPNGLLLGFAAFDETSIRTGLLTLSAALDRKRPKNRPGSLSRLR